MSQPEIPLHGTCDPRFRGVRDAFAENFASRGDVGASVAVMLDDQLVVDLWGGHLDAARSRPWPRDGVATVWSLGKAMSALCVLALIDDGLVSASDPVARYWPEFAQGDKGSVSVEMLLAHQAGLPGVETPLPANAYFDWETMVGALAAQPPWWTPGSGHGYHTNTFGHLTGEIVRRVTGQRMRDFFRARYTDPLGADFYMGIDESQARRVADVVHSEPPADFRGRGPDLPDALPADADRLTRMRWSAYRNPGMERDVMNTQTWRGAEFPSTNPQANARGTATILGAAARALRGRSEPAMPSQTVLRDAVTPRTSGDDLVVQRPTRFGLGLQLSQPDRLLGRSLNAFGHYGAGGHLGFGDPDVPLGFAYHMNHQGHAWRDPRNIALVDALYDAL